MYHPTLFYGVNLGRIPKEKKQLPKEVRAGEDFFHDVDIEKLEELVKKNGLEVFVEEGLLGYSKNPKTEQIHIGISIGEDYGRKSGMHEAIRFNVKQIIDLRQNPSELIEKLKRIGLDVKPEELALYGVTSID